MEPNLLPYILLDKRVGETPLETLETWRLHKPEFKGVPMAYAGRLDPMASGKLLVLIGEECKRQEAYHHLDKEYQVEILLGAQSDTGDVLGIIKEHDVAPFDTATLTSIMKKLVGSVELPYPVFSSKTVHGKPLHTWAVENRLHEITIPTRKSDIYALTLDTITQLSRSEVVAKAFTKIESIPPVTDPRKALGNDFRRDDVRKTWNQFLAQRDKEDVFTIIRFTCICSSGTYMRTLSEVIAKELDTQGLAFSIHRSVIGTFDTTTNSWSKKF